jgi:hypothetical protein
MVTDAMRWLGLVAACLLPLWNIPLILHLERRKSSKEINRTWAWGVWGCLLAMLPSGVHSPDPIFRIFSILNVVLFTGVVVQVMRYNKGKQEGP